MTPGEIILSIIGLWLAVSITVFLWLIWKYRNCRPIDEHTTEHWG